MVDLYPLSEAYKVVQKPKQEEEPFVSEEDTKKSVASIFMSVGLMILALFLGGLMFWAYRKERSLMIVVLSVFVFIYSIIMTLGIIQRGKLDKAYFLTIVGSSIFISVMMVILIIVFSIVASRRLSKSYLGPQTQDYLSRTTDLN